jgi:hypothetical protein
VLTCFSWDQLGGSVWLKSSRPHILHLDIDEDRCMEYRTIH